MNILIAITSLKYGGPQKVMINLTNELISQGHSCYLYIPKFGFSVSNKNYIHLAQCPILSIEKSKIYNFFISFLNIFFNEKLVESIKLYLNALYLKSIVKKKKINLVISNRFETDALVYEVLKKNTLQTSWTIVEHGDYSKANPQNQKERDLYFSKFYQECNRVIVLSDIAFIRLIKKYNIEDCAKMIKIYNGMNPKFKNIYKLPEKFKIALAARPERSKGWEEAIQAVIELNTELGNIFELHLLGSGEYLDTLSNKYQSIEINFKGFVSDVQQYLYDNIDIGILPTSDDILPTSIIEYLSVGIPVVAYEVGEIKNMLYNVNGVAGEVISILNLSFETRKELLKVALKKYHANPKKYFQDSKQAVGSFKKFDIQSVAEQYLSS